MPLPSGGTWPPPALAPIYDQYAVHSAWYEGNPDDLAMIYGDTTANAARPLNRPSQYRGGLVGIVGRAFWGRPTPAGERRSKLHIPLASDIATASADLLYSEPLKATVEDSKTQDRLDELIDERFQATLLENAEIGSALGGAYLRVVWDEEMRDRPWGNVVHPDAAVPEWRYGCLRAVTFWQVVEQDGNRMLYHLERHEVVNGNGVILHGLYDGGPNDLGKPVDLGAHAATRDLLPVVTTGIDKLTAVYLPNMRPNREWRQHPAGANLGRSDYSTPIFGLMDSLDEVWSSWMRDIRLAKARILVPRSYLETSGIGQGATFDLDREAYEAFNALPGQNGLDLTANQFSIRVDEHQRTALELTQKIVGSAGYSAQTFGLMGDVAVTATEVVARERRSFTTRNRKIVYQRPELADFYETLLMIDAVVFKSGVTPEQPDLEFGDSVSEDPKSTAETVNLLNQAIAASIDTKVRLAHPEWDDTQVEDEVEKIKDENGIGEPVADPLAIRPVDGAFPPDPNAPPVQEDPTNAPPADGPPAGGD